MTNVLGCVDSLKLIRDKKYQLLVIFQNMEER
ncbi:hypothetical protein Nos7524_3259 [Nostoc sp. PCC 7524]|nr:hypothetical protein Nos7524_3259 [Nostoc sp. PCC 7524]